MTRAQGYKRIERNVYRRPDGRFEVRFMLNGNSHSEYKETLEAARLAKAGLVLAQQDGRLHPISTMALGVYLRFHYLPERASRVKSGTARGHRLNAHRIDAVLGKTPLNKLDRRVISQAYTRLHASGPGLRRSNRSAEDLGGPLSARSVEQVHEFLHAALEYAVLDKLLPQNPATHASLPVDHTPKQRVFATGQGVREFLDFSASSPWVPLWTVLFTTGMRIGEACGLKWTDVDESTGRVTIWRQVQRVDLSPDEQERLGRKTALRFQTTKTHRSERAITLPRLALDRLAEHRLRQADRRTTCGEAWAEQGLIFTAPRKHGQPLDPAYAWHLWQRDWNAFRFAMKQGSPPVELPHMKVHDTRRSVATSLMLGRVPDGVAIKVLGQTNASVYHRTYAIATDESLDAAALVIERQIVASAAPAIDQ